MAVLATVACGPSTLTPGSGVRAGAYPFACDSLAVYRVVFSPALRRPPVRTGVLLLGRGQAVALRVEVIGKDWLLNEIS